MSIHSFQGEYRFLSNFYPCEVEHRGRKFPTVEHAFQAAKTDVPSEIEYVAAARTPGDAKLRGKTVILRKDWETVKIDIMRELLHSKFSDPELRKKLDDTKPHRLYEGNLHGDTFWGVCRGKGRNVLGWLLMEVRDGQESGV